MNKDCLLGATGAFLAKKRTINTLNFALENQNVSTNMDSDLWNDTPDGNVVT